MRNHLVPNLDLLRESVSGCNLKEMSQVFFRLLSPCYITVLAPYAYGHSLVCEMVVLRKRYQTVIIKKAEQFIWKINW